MPSWRSRGGTVETSAPFRKMRPELGAIAPAMMFRIVLLPDPLLPRRLRNSPRRTARAVSCSAPAPLYALLTPSKTIMASSGVGLIIFIMFRRYWVLAFMVSGIDVARRRRLEQDGDAAEDERQGREQRGDRGNHGGNVPLDAAVHLDGQRGGRRAGQEPGDHDLVERDQEREQRARQERRLELRQHDLEEHGRAAGAPNSSAGSSFRTPAITVIIMNGTT